MRSFFLLTVLAALPTHAAARRALLFLIASIALAQPVTFSTTGYFAGQQVETVFSSTSSTGTFRLELLPPAGQQTADAPVDRFGLATFGTLRVTLSGDPFRGINRFFPPVFLYFRIETAGGQSGVFGGEVILSTIGTSLTPVPRLVFQNLNPLTLNGVHFSAETRFVDLTPPAGQSTFDIPIRARLTRGGFVFGVPSVTIDVTPGLTTNHAVPLTLPAGTVPEPSLITDVIATGGTATEGRITVYLGRATFNFTATFFAEGVPSASIPVQVRILPPLGFTVEPELLTFRYQRGDPNPPAQYITLRAVGAPLTLSGWFYDGNWISVPRPITVTPDHPVQVPITPDMTTKNVGFHDTIITLRTDDFQLSRPVRVAFEVYDLPGSLNVTSTGRGTVTLTPNLPSYPNGTRVLLTATPDRYYGFTSWTGSIPSPRNPLEITVNGPMNFHTDFAFLGVSASCNVKLTPGFIYAPPEGDVGRIEVNSNCPWQVTGSPSWLRIESVSDSPASGSYFSYSVDPNPTATARSAVFQIGGTSFTAEQAAPGCAAIRPNTPGPIRAEGSAAFSQLFGAENCPEPQRRSSSWLLAPSPALPISGFVPAEANPYSLPRTATVYSGGTRMPLIQEGRLAAAPYQDLSIVDSFTPHVHLLKSLGIADPCTPNLFCPGVTVTRAEAARFIVSAMFRGSAFPSSQTPAFTDVPVTHSQFRFIQKLAELRITAGCGAGRFCPDRALTRGELAALLARSGARVSPGSNLYPPAVQYFQDVAPGAAFFDAIQKIRQWGVANGCDAINYCPNEAVTRAQVAVMIVRSLLTPY